jgi:hypothetical protein
MTLSQPFNLDRWIGTHCDLLKHPVVNKPLTK